MTPVKARFQCNSIFPGLQPGAKMVNFNAVYDENGMNGSFTTATPAGTFSLIIDPATPAIDAFEQGKDYFFTIELAE